MTSRKMDSAMRDWESRIAEIERDADCLPMAVIVKRLVGIAGIVVTGVIGNTNRESVVRDWIVGSALPERERQLRFAYVLTEIVAAADGPVLVQSWFKGANISLGGRAPALVLRDDLTEETRDRIMSAAKRRFK
jgi:hypothetical protein